MNTLATPTHSRLARFLTFVERAGNKLPHPGTLFAGMALLVILVSWITAQFQLEVAHPGTGEILCLATDPALKYSELEELDLSKEEDLALLKNRAVSDTYEPGSVM